jgi:transposase
MQIKALNHGIYKLAGYAYRHQVKEMPETGYSNPVNQWKKLKLEGVSDAVCSEIVGISRATYYRYCQRITVLSKGIKLPTRKPKKLNKACWVESQKQRVLEVRRENPTYGKEKITVILKRDFGLEISVSMVGRILKHLTACEARKIPLYVLPPRRPKYNGGVERTNRTFREEFYDSNRLQADSIGAMRCELKQALKKYNEYRPRQGLQGLTPMAYIQKTTSAVLSQNA